MKPPETLSKEAKVVWKDLLSTLPETHFYPCDAGVLAQYCETLVDLEVGRKAWRDMGCPWTEKSTGGNKAHPHLTGLQRQSTVLSQLAAKLRICPSARMSKEKAGYEKPRKQSTRAHLLNG